MDASRPNKGNFKHCPKIGIQGQVSSYSNGPFFYVLPSPTLSAPKATPTIKGAPAQGAGDGPKNARPQNALDIFISRWSQIRMCPMTQVA